MITVCALWPVTLQILNALRRRIMSLPGAGDVEANVLSSEERLLGPLLPL